MVLTDRAPTADGEGPRDCKSVGLTDRAPTADGEGPQDLKSVVSVDRSSSYSR